MSMATCTAGQEFVPSLLQIFRRELQRILLVSGAAGNRPVSCGSRHNRFETRRFGSGAEASQNRRDRKDGSNGCHRKQRQKKRLPRFHVPSSLRAISRPLRNVRPPSLHSLGATTKIPLPATGTKTCLFLAFAATEWLPNGT